MPNRQKHQEEVRRFLQKNFPGQSWFFSHPQGTGMETYFAKVDEQEYFVKVGVPLKPYQVMAEIGLTPHILAAGQLENGSSVMVQPRITGRNPSRRDYREQWDTIAGMIRIMHSDPRIREILQPTSLSTHKEAGLRALKSLRKRWEHHKVQVPAVAEFVENSLEQLEIQIKQFSTAGLVSSHNDICNANWLFASDGNVYIIDFEPMSMDDPALDLGALLWWYYPPELRGQFLQVTGYPYDDDFKVRMQVRMALHCLSIILPREESFDSFVPERFGEALVDFKAVLDGKENPQGYHT